ncbi:hypothetical protein GCM10018793_46200 [Streptomyces sulfonofaciens]|uniref:Uncharacterized protein n=1 Tax=Streptomyces sulfonofaciens TaxID=68272 RepID=A0A919GFG4_9ACTN|nr:hypothetical protein [Streptomyces sulfonofaciens]GHH83630.1 hypothetical protein GCM10018793_46200 [Streptomyces sulfonofaciens]
MDTIANSLFLAVPALPVLWLWGRPLFTGRWRTPGWFVSTALLCVVATVATWFIGALAGTSLDAAESCTAAGFSYDSAYRSAHWREASRWFPLHDKCNATDDLVPAWVNPALVLLPLLALTCLGAAVRLAVAHRRNRKGTA